MIDQEVTITESYIPEFSISTFVADLGGSLGLWLGVGAVQLLSTGVGLLRRTRTTLCKTSTTSALAPKGVISGDL